MNRKILLLLGVFVASLSVTATALPAQAKASNHVDQAFVLLIENHSAPQIRKGLPKTWAIVSQYGTGVGTAPVHPSQGNYAAIFSGSIQGIHDDDPHNIKAPSYFDTVPARTGKLVKTYAQGAGPNHCNLKNRGKYKVKHNPQTLFLSGSVTVKGKKMTKRQLCEQTNFDGFDSHRWWQRDLKANRNGVINHVLADQNHDWHDGSARQADDFASARLREFIASPAYRNGAAFIITADEDNKKGANDVPYYVVQKSLKGKHRNAGTHLSHYQLAAFLAEVGNVPRLANAKSQGGKFAHAFGLTA